MKAQTLKLGPVVTTEPVILSYGALGAGFALGVLCLGSIDILLFAVPSGIFLALNGGPLARIGSEIMELPVF